MPRKTKRVSRLVVGKSKRAAVRGKHNPRSKAPKTPKYLRDMEHPTVLGYELDRTTLTPIRRPLPPRVAGQDYGSDPIGDGTFRMVPSGDIVDFEERNRRLRRGNPYSSKESERVMYHLGYTRGGQDKANTFGTSLDTDKILAAGNWHIDNQLSAHYLGYERARPILVAAFERGYYDGFSGRSAKMKRVSNPTGTLPDTYPDPKTPYELGFNQGFYDSEAGHRERTLTDIMFLRRSFGNRFPHLALSANDERPMYEGYEAGWRAAAGGDKRMLEWEVGRTGRMNPGGFKGVRYYLELGSIDLPRMRREMLLDGITIEREISKEFIPGAGSPLPQFIVTLPDGAHGYFVPRRGHPTGRMAGKVWYEWHDLGRHNPTGDPEDFKSAGYLPTILKSLESEGQFYDVMREHHGLSFMLRRHDDGDLTAVVRDMDQGQRGPEVVVPPDQIADVYHYALHHGTMEGWEPGSEGYAPIGQAELDEWEAYPDVSLENPRHTLPFRPGIDRVEHFRPRFVQASQMAELANLWHLSRTHSNSRWERMQYTSKWFAKEHPELTATAVYKDLDAWLAFNGMGNPAASPEQYRLAQAVLGGTARGHMPESVAREIVERTPAGLRSEYSHRNPDYRSLTDAFNAGKEFRTSGAYYETGVAKARVAKYGFNKWLNEQPKSVVGAKARLLKEFMEGYAAGKRLESAAYKSISTGARAREGNPDLFHVAKYDDRATEMGTAYRYGRRAGDARMDHDEARVRFENESYKKWLHLYADVKMRPQLEAEWRRGYTDTMGERQHNPADGAAALYEEFHGTPSESETVITEEIQYHGNLAELGTLVEIKVETLSGYKAVLAFESGPPLLCSSEDGKQLYIRGGDQSLDLDALHMNDDAWVRDSMVIGPITEFTYRTKKEHDGLKKLEYFHKAGEETGVRPDLIYDVLNNQLSVSGGQYEVKDVGVVN